MSLVPPAAGPGVRDEWARGRTLRLWTRLRGDRRSLVGAALVVGFVLVALLAPLLAPYDPSEGNLADLRPGFVPGPSARHPLGLDHQGRDELSRIIHGARHSLLVGVGSVVLGTVVGIVIGAAAAGLGGWVDNLLMRLMDVMLAVPGLLLAIGLAAVLGPSLPSVMIAIGVGGVPVVARLLRSAMLVERERDYVLAARAAGGGRWRIVFRHIVPNSLAPLLAASTLALGGAILDAAGLSFLGLGNADPSTPEWGRMLAETQRFLQSAPQLAFFPGAAIALAVLGFNLLGEALREALDPKIDR